MESLEQTVIQLRQKKKEATQSKQNAEDELRKLQSIEKRSSTGLHNVDKKIESGEIEIAPLAFMRGRTLKNCFAILDEAQNATETQIKMFLTRIGENSKLVVNGDPTQVDLINKTHSGLIKSKNIFISFGIIPLEISIPDEDQPAKVLSGGERRLLEISRALVMKPSVLLVDEPSIGLEPKYIDMVFEILRDLQQNEKKTIILVEQNAKKGLEFADIGYVLVSGQTAIAGTGNDLLKNPDVGRLFLGG